MQLVACHALILNALCVYFRLLKRKTLFFIFLREGFIENHLIIVGQIGMYVDFFEKRSFLARLLLILNNRFFVICTIQYPNRLL